MHGKKVASEKSRGGSPLPAAGLQTDDGAHGVTRPTTKLKSSALMDMRARRPVDEDIQRREMDCPP